MSAFDPKRTLAPGRRDRRYVREGFSRARAQGALLISFTSSERGILRFRSACARKPRALFQVDTGPGRRTVQFGGFSASPQDDGDGASGA
jgi:hypothetical protein